MGGFQLTPCLSSLPGRGQQVLKHRGRDNGEVWTWGSSASSPAPWYSQDGEGPAAGGPGHPSHGGPAAVQQPLVAAAEGRAEAPGLLPDRGCCQQQCQEEERAAGPGQAHGAAAGPAGVAGQPGHRPGVCAGLASPHGSQWRFWLIWMLFFFFFPCCGMSCP